MNKKRLQELADNPNFISGIYNYCDRWCERCAFTSRCMNYAFSEEEFDDPESRDINNKAFWEKMTEIFKITEEMLQEIARKLGIDLDATDMEEISEKERRLRLAAEENECAVKSREYATMVKEWFDTSGDVFKLKADEINYEVELEFPNSDPLGKITRIEDSIDVIHWYQNLIYVKLMRALQGRLDDRDEELEDFPKDSDGSAKIALIAIDRSIAAWGEMLRQFSEKEDVLLKILIHLDKLRRRVEREFPHARTFIRPGFDGEDVHNRIK